MKKRHFEEGIWVFRGEILSVKLRSQLKHQLVVGDFLTRLIERSITYHRVEGI